MKKRNFFYLSLAVLVFFLGFVGCGPDKKESVPTETDVSTAVAVSQTQKPAEYEATPENSSEKWQKMLATDMNTLQQGDPKAAKGSVYVVAFHPQGQTRKVNEVDEINITFSQPVAPLEKIQKDKPSLIKLEPQIKGEGFWKSSTTYCYRIDEKLSLSTRYKVLFKGYMSFDGKNVEKKEWEFTTPLIIIKRIFPYNESKWKTLREKVLVQFSQNVVPNKIREHIKINSRDGEQSFRIRHASEEERKLFYYRKFSPKDYPKFAVITPTRDYPVSSNIQVKFLPGLLPMEGNVGMLKERRLSFRTYEVFEIVSVSESFEADAGIRVKFSNPVAVKNFIEKIRIEPEVELTPHGKYNSHDFRVRGKFKPGVTYKVTIPADLEDIFGNRLGEERTFRALCLDYSSYLYAPSYNHFVLENYLEKKLPVRTRNVFETDVFYKKLTIGDIKKLYYFEKYEYGDYSRLNPYQMNLDSCSKITWKPPVQKNRDYVVGYDLEKIGLDDPGYYFISFEHIPDPGEWPRSFHLFQLSDMALVAKYSPSQIFLIPFHMKTGQLLPSQNFKLYDFSVNKDRATQIVSFTSGQDGIARYDAPMDVLKKYPIRRSFVFSSPDQAFIWGNKPDMFDIWEYGYESGLQLNYNPNYLYNRVMLFTDKYLYKGGDTVLFKAIFRQILKGDLIVPGVKQIDIEVFNSRNQSIHKLKVDPNRISSFGSFAGKFDLPRNAPTGFYRVQLKMVMDDSKFSQDYQFSVEEYKPAKFEVKVHLDQKSIVSGEMFSGRVNGRYLFGTPMVSAKGYSTWTLKNHSFRPAGWKRYTFGTSESRYRNVISKKDFELNEGGDYPFKKKNLRVTGKNSALLTIHGEVKDKDNNRISGSRSMVIHRGRYYIGLKTGAYFFKQKKPGKISLVTVDSEGKIFSGPQLVLKIIREEWKSFQKKDASGVLRWNWNRITENIIDEKVDPVSGKFEGDFTFEKSGYYRIAVTGKDELDNMITTTGHFYVTGTGYVSWGVNEGRTIDLVTDQEKYRPGDNIELLIKSPFESSTAVVTVEREKVIWSKVIRMEGNADTVRVPVHKDFVPNVFVNVIILKERTGLKWDEEGKDIGKPEFYSGYKGIPIDASEHRLTVVMKADKPAYEPGEEVTLKMNVTDHEGKPVESEVCLSVVDRGVLNLVGYELPDPFAFFWQKRLLDVKTVSTLSDVLGRRKFAEKGEDPGGGGGLSPFGSVVVRKNFKENAFYNAYIQTDKNGEAEVSFTLPDNLTTFRAMVVTGDKWTKFGRGKTDILVKKHVVLKPALPDFVRSRDKFSGGVTVTNNSDEKRTIAVQVESKNVQRAPGDQDIKKVTLKPYHTEAVTFDFQVNDTKPILLTFKAVSEPYQDGLVQEIPVRLPLFLEGIANFGRVEEQPVTEQVIVPDGTLRSMDHIELTLASSAVVGVKRNFDILQEFRYDCLEQRISKQYPLLGAGDFLLTYGLIDMTKEEMSVRIQKLLDLMPKYQLGGGFTYYPDSIHPSDYLTCYAMEFVLDAKKQGFAVDSNMIKNGLAFLKKVAANKVNLYYPYTKSGEYLIQSYAVYVLSKENIQANDGLNNLFEVRDRIPFTGLAYLMKAMDVNKKLPAYMQPVLTKTILNKMKDAPTMVHFENPSDEGWCWVHESNVKTTAIVLDALLDVYQKFPFAEKIARWLATTTRQKRFLSTQEHIRLFMAFEKYYRTFEKETPDFVADVLLNGKNQIQKAFSGRELKAHPERLALSEYSPEEKLNFQLNKNGTGTLYYLLRLKYYPVGTVPAIDRGFSVTKIYRHLDGSLLKAGKFKTGEKYIVEVQVKTDLERTFVVLDDPVPAGLKVLNPRFKIHSELDKKKVTKDSGWGGYWGLFYRSEYYFDRVEVFADYLRRGTHTWKYLVLATNGGEFEVPNTVVSEMYNPEVFGRNENQTVVIK